MFWTLDYPVPTPSPFTSKNAPPSSSISTRPTPTKPPGPTPKTLKPTMPPKPLPPTGEIVLYPTADGRSRVECRFAGETVWLTQALMSELFEKDVRTINEHLQNLFEDEELDP